MKIILVNDKPNSAIARLSGYIKKYNPQHEIVSLSLHPKRPSIEELTDLAEHLKDADILHVMYWKSGEVIRERFPKDFERIKTVLTHHNPYDIHNQVWSDIYDNVVVVNQEQQQHLGYAYLINLSVDINEFEYTKEYETQKVVQMVVGRIEGKKGVREVAQACHELGYKLLLVGRISKRAYFDDFMGKYSSSIEFIPNASEEVLKKTYHQATIHVCNSTDGFETGTLPILEAMASGLPVVTRIVGHVPDLYNGKNLSIIEGKQDDVEAIKKALSETVDNQLYREKIRENAWQTVRSFNAEKMAREYSKVYWRTIESKPLISIIIPTCNRPENLVQVLSGALIQTYPKYEIVVADSSDDDKKNVIEQLVEKLKKQYKKTIKYIPIKRHGYNLAEARNTAVIESEGELLVFCDDRLVMNRHALEVFSERYIGNCWLWGNKDGYKKGFVENFSCIGRDEFIRGGMFTTSIKTYGGLTQETRTRFDKQGIIFQHCEEANAESISKAKSKISRMKDIYRSKLHIYKMYG